MPRPGVEEFRVTFNPRMELPEGLDRDGYAVVEAVSMEDAVAAASLAWPGLWNMVYRAAAWTDSHLVHLYPAGEVARVTTGAATVAGLVIPGTPRTLIYMTPGQPITDCPTCGNHCKGHAHLEWIDL